MTWQERAAQLDGTPDYTHQVLKEEGYTVSREVVRHFFKTQRIDFKDKRQYTEQDLDACIAVIREYQRTQEKLNTKQTKATIKLNETKPIGIAFWGDWHEGGAGTDYDGLDEDTEIIANTDGLYWGGMGDYKDNYITGTHPGGNFEQIVQPGMQDKMVERRMQKAAYNNLWLIRGCHDDWDKKQGDKDFIESLCNITGGVNLWHGGTIFVELGEQKYCIKARHKFKFESGLNVENSMRRMFDMQGEFDVAVSAHLHFGFYMDRPLGGAHRVLAKSGGYKKWDEHGQKIGGYEAERNIPTVILFPKEKHMLVMYLRDAVFTLNALRK